MNVIFPWKYFSIVSMRRQKTKFLKILFQRKSYFYVLSQWSKNYLYLPFCWWIELFISWQTIWLRVIKHKNFFKLKFASHTVHTLGKDWRINQTICSLSQHGYVINLASTKKRLNKIFDVEGIRRCSLSKCNRKRERKRFTFFSKILIKLSGWKCKMNVREWGIYAIQIYCNILRERREKQRGGLL